MPTDNNKSLRQQLRARRRALSVDQQRQAAAGLATNLSRLTSFHNSRRIALYLSSDGEIDPCHCMAMAIAAGKKCYLPVLHPLKINRLLFARYHGASQLKPNRFGILEPGLRNAKLIRPWALNLMLLPLVAFDANCNRIGMGGGFYDRTLAFRKKSPSGLPLLIGVAHSCQQIDSIEPSPWDIPLDMVVTDTGVFHARKINATTTRH